MPHLCFNPTPFFDQKTRNLRGVALGFVVLFFLLATSASAHYRWYNSSGIADSSTLISTWKSLSLSHQDIREWALTPDGEWVLISQSKQVFYSSGFPQEARNVINTFNMFDTVDAIAFAPDGEFVVTAGIFSYLSPGVPHRSTLESKIMEGRAYNGNRLTELVFTPDDNGWVVSAGGWAWYYNVPSDLADAVDEVIWWSDRTITGIAIGPDERWVLVADHWFASSGLSDFHFSKMQELLRDGVEITHVAISSGNGFLVYADHSTYSPSNDMDRLEMNVDGKNIYERMHEINVQGVSIAVIEDNKVRYARGYGVLEADTQRWVRHDSPFDTASLSKYLGALTLMTLVNDGTMSLLDDAADFADIAGTTVHAWNQQLSTPIPDNMYLYRLLSHSASIKANPSPFWEAADWPSQGLTTLELLNGDDGGKQVKYDSTLGLPGTSYLYSGGSFLLAEAMAEDVTGEDFADLMQTRVFDALDMEDTTVVQPLTSEWEDRAALPHDSSGNLGTPYIYPWRSAGGVYASAADYAKAMIVLMRGGQGENGRVLINPTLAGIMQSEIMLKDNGGYYGQGVSVSGSTFSHTGAHGEAVSLMYADRSTDKGIVVMVNGGGDDAKDFRIEIQAAFLAEF